MNENRDALTGLWSWKYVQSILPGILGHNGQVALILADVDRLKSFHDDYGHPPTDKVLIEIAREIESLSGENALVFRHIGDNFGVILYESSLEDAREIAEKIRAARTPFPFDGWKGQEIVLLKLSLGVAHSLRDGGDLVKAAGLALGRAKEGGRNRVSE